FTPPGVPRTPAPTESARSSYSYWYWVLSMKTIDNDGVYYVLILFLLVLGSVMRHYGLSPYNKEVLILFLLVLGSVKMGDYELRTNSCVLILFLLVLGSVRSVKPKTAKVEQS